MGRGKKKGRRRGHRPHYRGKPLWQLLDNLPNHGVGRLLVRGSFRQDMDAPSFMRILEVDMSSKMVKRGKGKKGDKIRIPVKVERVWRGVIFPRPVNIASTSYLSDFILVAKDEEEKYLKNAKTPNQVGYVYWNAAQKRHIRDMIAGGLAPAEAKQREKERIAREEAEQAEREGRAPSTAPVMQLNQTDFIDNFDEDDEGETSGSFDSDYQPEEKKEPKKKNTNNDQTRGITPKGSDYEMSRNKVKRYNQYQEKHRRPREEFHRNENVQEDFGEFSALQKERIERMVKNGMDPDTAKQLEWERQTALEANADSGLNEAEAGPSSSLKRSMPEASNEYDRGKEKVAKIG
ncbi:PREDICTED: uncharacterized protein LOC108359351 [Rhagoletis zephyria]|uniref:uncharacterized protein LOC108359351 n=1 Tax=Rhagoletis zephyria TaxID=28612 RepID=UPI0008119659|nr:PREDICTED: uncharacterized protein LOC108359351 [Rhagoletis zephyria]XP_036337789.1 uncharacterized protein LOC118747771 [Rhagoletis pomonella]